MDSTVRRPTHYEALGLEPTASLDEIAQAYGRELRSPRTIGQIARAGVAYEVLRDPARRDSYDRSIGIAKEPEAALLQWSSESPFRAPYMRTARAAPAAAKPVVTAPSPTHAEPPSDARDDQRLPSFLATALRDIARPEPLQASGAVAPPPPRAEVAAHAPESSPHAPAIDAGEAEDSPIEWKRIGIGAGALVAVAGLFGVWAGSNSAADTQSLSQHTATSSLLPPATPFPSSIGDGPASNETTADPIRNRAPSVVAASPTALKARKQPLVSLPEKPSLPDPAPVQLTSSEGTASPAQQPPAEMAAAATKAASMPLPNQVITRTIERIGYSCGQVTAADEVAGEAPGVFKISCTSGQAFQARPIDGRYRFKRLNR